MRRGHLLPDDVTRPTALPMVGSRFGSLTVLSLAGRRDHGINSEGWRQRSLLWLVRCDCGVEFTTLGGRLRGDRYYQGTRQCRACAEAEGARRGRMDFSVRLSDGRTIAQIAAASGLKVNTVYRRYLRGWPPEYLGVETKGRRGYGGSEDLPERRRTTRPDVRGI